MRNDKSISGVFEYMFVDTGKILDLLGKEPPVMTNTVSVDIDLAREIYERLLSGWTKLKKFGKKKRARYVLQKSLVITVLNPMFLRSTKIDSRSKINGN